MMKMRTAPSVVVEALVRESFQHEFLRDCRLLLLHAVVHDLHADDDDDDDDVGDDLLCWFVASSSFHSRRLLFVQSKSIFGPNRISIARKDQHAKDKKVQRVPNQQNEKRKMLEMREKQVRRRMTRMMRKKKRMVVMMMRMRKKRMRIQMMQGETVVAVALDVMTTTTLGLSFVEDDDENEHDVSGTKG